MQQSDDLTMIEGIEPAFEKRLNSAGIHTFAELQSKSPEVLAKLFIGQKGVSARLIREMDWIGQARQLSDEIKSQDTLMQSQAEQHYAVFTVELLLDKENNVRRTRAKSVSSSDQSGQTENPSRVGNLKVCYNSLSIKPNCLYLIKSQREIGVRKQILYRRRQT